MKGEVGSRPPNEPPQVPQAAWTSPQHWVCPGRRQQAWPARWSRTAASLPTSPGRPSGGRGEAERTHRSQLPVAALSHLKWQGACPGTPDAGPTASQLMSSPISARPPRELPRPSGHCMKRPRGERDGVATVFWPLLSPQPRCASPQHWGRSGPLQRAWATRWGHAAASLRTAPIAALCGPRRGPGARVAHGRLLQPPAAPSGTGQGKAPEWRIPSPASCKTALHKLGGFVRS
jgi:hypothetical protein